MSRILLEAAVESFEGAIAAAGAGADRLELCSHLEVGGLTPPLELFNRIRAAIPIPIVVMIRPRQGDFVYSAAELNRMAEQIQLFGEGQPDGFVFGVSTDGGAIDSNACANLIGRCGGMPAVYHRAWDERPRTLAELETLIELGFTRLLTSGGAVGAFAGMASIRGWLAAAVGRIEILPGAGIDPGNVGEIVRRTGCNQVHGTFKNTLREIRAVLDQRGGGV